MNNLIKCLIFEEANNLIESFKIREQINQEIENLNKLNTNPWCQGWKTQQ